MFAQQSVSLVQQAMYLIEQVPKLVTAPEYNTVAITLADSGDIILADRYYRKAIDTSLDGYMKALATRSYAAFIFRQRRFEDTRELFIKSLSLFRSSDNPNLVRHVNGFTYQMWALNELQIANAEKRAEEIFESARNEFRGIDIEPIHQQALNTLEKLKNNPKSIDTAPIGVDPLSLSKVSQSNV